MTCGLQLIDLIIGVSRISDAPLCFEATDGCNATKKVVENFIFSQVPNEWGKAKSFNSE